MRAPEQLTRLECLVRDAALEHTRDIPVLGIRTSFLTNSPAVLGIVEEAFGGWGTLPFPAIERVPAAAVRVFVHDDPETAPITVRHEPDGARLLVSSAASAGRSDPAVRAAWAFVARALVADRDTFRHDVLEALTWALLTRFDRQPFHAAALAQDDAVLLLAGASGSGKSTLAYAAARAGMQVQADDMVFLQAHPHIRVWARPTAIRLLPDTAAHFAELAHASPVRLHNGKLKFVTAPTAAVSRAAPACVFERCALCVLGERRPAPELRRLTMAELMAAIDLRAEAGFDAFADSLEYVVRSIARPGGWLLHPGSSPDASLPLLRAVLGELSHAPVPA
jgi:energy-coupling factor transporter ATP-binding protein EcfA2